MAGMIDANVSSDTNTKPSKPKFYATLSNKDKEKLVNEFLPLVKKIARGLARRATDPVDDLIQVGSIGLLEAIDRYEMGHNTAFKTYAVHFITGHIRHYLRDRQTLLRGPRALQELSYRLNQVTSRLAQEYGRDPSHEELALALDISPQEVDQVRTYDRRVTVLWLDQDAYDSDEDENRTLMESLHDRKTNGPGREDTVDRLMLSDAMAKLSESQRELIKLRYFQDYTQAELSRTLGISQMEVCRRLKKAEKMLKQSVGSQMA
jgi:RNA polymerase sigma factor (sigma-70 family)